MATMTSFPNVGTFGGDLVARRFALIVILLLTVASVPWLGFTQQQLKIASLIGAMAGSLFLMAGLVFVQKTHYAGLTLIPVPLAMVWISSTGWRWMAVLMGVVVISVMVQNLIT